MLCREVPESLLVPEATWLEPSDPYMEWPATVVMCSRYQW